MPQAAIYARVSTDEQAEHGTSLESQVEACTRFAKDHAPTLHVVPYVDSGISGKLLERPKLQAMLTDVSGGGIQLVVAWDPDRLSRNLSHLLLLTDSIREKAELRFVNFEAGTGPDGELLYHVRGAIGQFEAAHIRQRLYRGKVARAREGKVASGTCIYGYRLDKVSKRWVIEPSEAQVVPLIFEWALTMGTHQLATKLNGMGIPSRFGRKWATSTLNGILRNRTYLGHMPQMREGHVAVPPLVDEGRFEQVQRVLARRLNHAYGKSARYLLSGYITCGVCGRAVAAGWGSHVRKSDGVRVTYYGCTARVQPAAERTCTAKLVQSDKLDEGAWRVVLEALHDRTLAESAVRTQEDPAHAEVVRADVARIEKALADLAGERERLVRALRKDLIAEDEFLAQRKELDGEERILRQRREDAAARLAGMAVSGADVARVLAALGAFAQKPDELSFARKRELIAAVGLRCVLQEDGTLDAFLGRF
jgi:site-specific DNA recombinase